MEGDAAFIKIKHLIVNCTLLFFMDDDAPIFLQTDASDYGIGAYLFQIKDTKEYPICFLSQALSPEKVRW